MNGSMRPRCVDCVDICLVGCSCVAAAVLNVERHLRVFTTRAAGFQRRSDGLAAPRGRLLVETFVEFCQYLRREIFEFLFRTPFTVVEKRVAFVLH